MPNVISKSIRDPLADQPVFQHDSLFVCLTKKVKQALHKGNRTKKNKSPANVCAWYIKTGGKYVEINHDFIKSSGIMSAESQHQVNLFESMRHQELELAQQVKMLSEQVSKLQEIVEDYASKSVQIDAKIHSSHYSIVLSQSATISNSVVEDSSETLQVSGAPPPPPPPPSGCAPATMYRQSSPTTKPLVSEPQQPTQSDALMEEIRLRGARRAKITAKEMDEKIMSNRYQATKRKSVTQTVADILRSKFATIRRGSLASQKSSNEADEWK